MDRRRCGAGCGELVAVGTCRATASAGVVAPVTARKDRPPSPPDQKESGGHTDRSDLGGVPARREPQHADARRRSAAVREAGGRGPQLHPRDVRGDARRRGDRAALPQAPATAPRAPPASWSGRRTTSSTSSTTSATARCPSRAGSASCSTSAAGCTAPGWPGSGRCGRRTSSRGCATAGSRMYTKIHHALVDGVSAMRLLQSVLTTDPDKRDMPAPWGAAAGSPQQEARAGPQPLRGPDERAPHRARHHRRGRRHAQRPGQDDHQGAPQRDLGALPLRPAHDLQPEHHRLATLRRPGLADRAAARHRQGHRHHAERRGAGDVQRRGARLPARARRAARGAARRDGAGRPQRQAVARRLGRGRQRGRRGDGASSPPTAATPPTGSRRSTPR